MRVYDLLSKGQPSRHYRSRVSSIRTIPFPQRPTDGQTGHHCVHRHTLHRNIGAMKITFTERRGAV